MSSADETSGPEQDARRTYWAAQMEEADAFVGRIMTYPVEECSEPMAAVPEAAREAGVEVVFSERPHVEGAPRLYFLRRSLLPPFVAAAREMNARGWVLKAEDGYRSLDMQRGLSRKAEIFRAVLSKVQWETGESIPPTGLLFRRLGALVANTPKMGTHMSGSAMDISVLSRDTGDEVDRGGPYLEMSEKTPMASPYVAAEVQENRRAITGLLARHGFVAYPWEFWHYNSGDACAEVLNDTGRPARYGAVHLDTESGGVAPIDRPTDLLNSEKDMQARMERILAESA